LIQLSSIPLTGNVIGIDLFLIAFIFTMLKLHPYVTFVNNLFKIGTQLFQRLKEAFFKSLWYLKLTVFNRLLLNLNYFFAKLLPTILSTKN